MATRKKLDALFQEIRDEWDKAEADIKLAEQIGEQVVFPSIKELRYAGRRIVDALLAVQDGDEQLAIKYLNDAKFDCHRARHDAIDAGLSTIAAELSVYQKKIGYGPILAVLPDYSQLVTKLYTSQEKIVASRNDRRNRELVYKSIQEVEFTAIAQRYRAFKANEHIMRAVARKERLWRVVPVIISLVALIFAGMAVPWKEYFAKPECSATGNLPNSC
jgi:hypothetical protein